MCTVWVEGLGLLPPHQQQKARLLSQRKRLALYRMGRVDIVARGLVQLHGEARLDAVAEAMSSLHSSEAVQATVQVSLALARSNRPDIMTDVCISFKLCLCLSSHIANSQHSCCCLLLLDPRQHITESSLPSNSPFARLEYEECYWIDGDSRDCSEKIVVNVMQQARSFTLYGRRQTQGTGVSYARSVRSGMP